MKKKPCCPWLTRSMKIAFTVDWWHRGRMGIDHLAQHLEPDRIQDQKLQKKSKVNGVLPPKEPCARCHQQTMGPRGPLPPPSVGPCMVLERGQAGIILLGTAGVPGCRQSLNSGLGTVSCKDLLSSL